MKVRMTFTLEVDEEAWMREFAVLRSEVREDVISYYSAHVFDGSYPVEAGIARPA